MKPPRPLPPSSGAVVMALAIFALAAAPRLPAFGAGMALAIAWLLLPTWLFMALTFLAEGHAARGRDPVEALAVGTWVAGTAVSAELLLRTLPFLHVPALALGAIALGLWLWYLGLAWAGLRAVAGPASGAATGVVLLPAVATQSLLLLGHALVGQRLPHAPALALIALGYGLYAVGAVLILRRYLRQPHWRLAGDWDDTNCIVHGALSISGLAGTVTGVLPTGAVLATWVAAAVLFVVVEGLEFARMAQRLRRLGLRRAVLVYDVPQWARNFTVGMFYAFCVALQADAPARAALATLGLDRLLAWLVAGGAWVVLLLLIVEAALMLADRRPPPVSA